MSLPAVPRRLLRDEAYAVLLTAIVSGDLAPGQILRDGELAAQVGLSRTPVREALARLTDEGLVESKPHAYTRVTPLDRRDCIEAFVVLRALHELAAAEAAPRTTPQHVRAMREANARFAAALDAGHAEAALAADDDLHGVVLDAAANHTLAATIERLTPRIRRLERLRFGSLPGRESIAMHEKIIDALARHDPADAARQAGDNWSTLGRFVDAAFATDTFAATDPHPHQPKES